MVLVYRTTPNHLFYGTNICKCKTDFSPAPLSIPRQEVKGSHMIHINICSQLDVVAVLYDCSQLAFQYWLLLSDALPVGRVISHHSSQ